MKFKLALMAAAATIALAGPAAAHDVIYTATLKGTTEVPGNNSPAVGSGIVTINDDTFQMRVQVIFAGLTGTTTAAHIHCCTVSTGANAGVATQVPTFPGFPLGVTTGTYDQTFNMALLSSYNPAFLTANNLSTAGQAFSFFTTGVASGQAYLNVHTTTFGGGEIRGFLVAPAVPEPETYALMFAGLGVVGVVAARRRRVS